MIGLTKVQLQCIGEWINNNGRLLEIAKWDFLFNHGSKDNIIKEMLKYQNEDGGFGNGFEADILLPSSAAIPSAEAIFTAYNYELNCKANWFKKLLSYFENSIMETKSFWLKAPIEFESYPHAPWWSYQPDTKFTPNPSAIIASAMILYGTEKQRYIGNTVAKKCLDFLCSDDDCSEHDSYNLIHLIEVLQKVNSTLINGTVIKAMKRKIKDIVCFDESKWMNYVAQPLDIVNNPNSQWYELVSEGVENNFIFWEQSLNEEGVWTPNFSWGIDSEVSNQATRNWKGYLAVKRAKIFKNFGKIYEF